MTIDLGDLYSAELQVGLFLHHAIADLAAAARTEGRLPIVLAGNCNSGVIGCFAAAGRVAETLMLRRSIPGSKPV
jgi:hypothetical protein